MEHFLENPVPISDINIHQALIKQATNHLDQLTNPKEEETLLSQGFTPKKVQLILAKNPPNIRSEEYEYGPTTLLDPSLPLDLEKINSKREKGLTLGGNKFNTHPANSVEEKITDEMVKFNFQNIVTRLALKNKTDPIHFSDEIIHETVNLIQEIYQLRNIKSIEKKCDLFEGWVKEMHSSLHLEIQFPANFISQVKYELSLRVALEMMPVYQHKGESYTLKQLGLDESQIPPQFQKEGRFVPCDFHTYVNPDLTTVCCDTVPFAAPVIPTGKKIAIVMNGGQASGVGDVAVGAILAAGPENDVHIFTHGNDGLLRGDYVKATLEDLEIIRSQGGFPGGTTRTPLLTERDIQKVQKNIQDFDGVVFIGGDGSYRSNKDVFLTAGVPVYFCIKTIDGDFQVEDTDFTLGYYTAIEGYGEMIENRMNQAKEQQEMHFLQVGGRYAGYLSVGTSALLPANSRPNLAIYPEEIMEKKWSFKHVIDVLSKTIAYRMATNKPYAVFSIAEGTIQELPEVKALIGKIKEIKSKHPEIKDNQLKEFLKTQLSKTAEEGQLSLYETLLAFSDEDVKLLGKPDPIGRVPFAQIDSYAAFGRLVSARLNDLKEDSSSLLEIVEQNSEANVSILEDKKLDLTQPQLDCFLATPIPKTKGTKSNYDQRSRPAIKQDYNNGLLQGMAAGSAALFGRRIDGQESAIIATSQGRNNVVAISTKVKPGGEYIASSHPYVKTRLDNLPLDLAKK